jgi:sulfur relay (sulfurtransferase) DsrF/TusC family protein
MQTLTVVLKRPPYGQIEAAEAVRHALGAASGELTARLLLVDGGVHLARSGQETTGGGPTNLGETLQDCLQMGVSVYAEELSLQEHALAPEGIIAGVKIVPGSTIAELIASADATLLF